VLNLLVKKKQWVLKGYFILFLLEITAVKKIKE
jgi:hypothetical protein